MTINITVQRPVMPNKWHLCGNNGCENMVYGNKSVCLKCWVHHSNTHQDPLAKHHSKYFEDKN